ncbi:MAG: histone-like nucleoid-structuring protein Lsr2, partial [Actinomycetes bacterium]
MARKTVVKIIDDLDGTELAEGDATSVRFSLDGADYELDLSEANAGQLRDAVTPYIDAGRRIGGRRRSGGHTRRISTEVDTRAVRAWANANGVTVSSRGRIPQNVVEQYRDAGN